MNEVPSIKAFLVDLINVMAERAEKEVDALMPGYTHLQVGHSATRSDELHPLTDLVACTTGPLVALAIEPRPVPSMRS